MLGLEAQGHFDDAIQAGVQSVKGQPSDYFIYQMIARAYTDRAYKDPQQSSKWARLAAEYADKAMNADPTDLSNVFNVGQTYEIAGDNLPTSESCFYYQKAAGVFRELTPKLDGDRATIQGKSFRLAPFRLHNSERLSDVTRQLASCNDRVPTNEPRGNPAAGKAATQMVEYTRQGNYDKAVRTGLAALKEGRDGFIQQQIAMVYLQRAEKEPGLRDRWAREAVFYAEKSLEDDVQPKFLLLDEAGGIFEMAGDLSTSQSCEYYARALKAFSVAAPLLEGDYIALYGYRRPLAPLRTQNEKLLTRVREKAMRAGCK